MLFIITATLRTISLVVFRGQGLEQRTLYTYAQSDPWCTFHSPLSTSSSSSSTYSPSSSPSSSTSADPSCSTTARYNTLWAVCIQQSDWFWSQSRLYSARAGVGFGAIYSRRTTASATAMQSGQEAVHPMQFTKHQSVSVRLPLPHCELLVDENGSASQSHFYGHHDFNNRQSFSRHSVSGGWTF